MEYTTALMELRSKIVTTLERHLPSEILPNILALDIVSLAMMADRLENAKRTLKENVQAEYMKITDFSKGWVDQLAKKFNLSRDEILILVDL